jgi:antitoxin component YwqK of YwqJK toxin-antitoxin module
MFGQTNLDTIIIKSKNYSDPNTIYKDGYYKFINGKTINQEGQIKDNRKEGVWKFFFVNGKLEEKVEYHTKDSLTSFCGLYQEYYQNGELKTDGTYSFFDGDSLKCTVCFEYDTIQHFYKAVPWIKYSGEIRTGIWREYYENGQLKSIGEYSPSVVFDTKRFSERDKKKNHLWVVDYTKGFNPDKEWKFYSEAGKLEKTVTYDNGIVIKTITD